MLILSRRTGESIKIGDNITITALTIQDGNVRLGISAPKHVAVHREEIYDRILGENQNSTSEFNGNV